MFLRQLQFLTVIETKFFNIQYWYAFLQEDKNKLRCNIEPTRTTLNLSFENYVFSSLQEKVKKKLILYGFTSVNDVLRFL